MKFFDNYNIRDFKTSITMRREYFSTFRYNVQIDPQDYRYGLEPINKKQTNFTIKHDVR